jgi:hypothetical protein
VQEGYCSFLARYTLSRNSYDRIRKLIAPEYVHDASPRKLLVHGAMVDYLRRDDHCLPLCLKCRDCWSHACGGFEVYLLGEAGDGGHKLEGAFRSSHSKTVSAAVPRGSRWSVILTFHVSA